MLKSMPLRGAQTMTDPIDKSSAKAQKKAAKQLVALGEKEQAGFDLGSYRDAPSGIRSWGGATVETSDIEALLPWLDWAFAQVKNG